MNLLLVEPSEREEPGLARVDGRRARHLRRVLGKGVGDSLRVGELDGEVGEGTIEHMDADAAWIRYVLHEPPPPPSPVSLVLALPRPPMLRRTLQAVTSLGVKRIVLLHAARVEKSFWTSHSLTPEAIDEQLRLGLEQARDTVRPRVELRRRFRPFVEDELPGWATGRRVLAEPEPGAAAPRASEEPTTVAIGPEGGWVPFELEQWRAAGFGPVSLGPRILRVETAVVALVTRLGPA
ncbi:MAG: 16S rRNA (uracil(1498)-N(3))-methyltransferase [Myxococcales bacterium]|nr:16S rRNA (uracil(1498)-N(3))-methyltransferase [Myxococcales bacterium]MCB9715259.1 16S rRNA (uracil(1498)-N(3))-methyltransferase [Myxococcales bacterium]